MGGGTSGWMAALYFLNKSKKLNLNLKIKLISSNDISPIGVGEGTLPSFSNFIENICNIDKKEFLKETKGSFKYGVKFINWNFDNEYFYNPVSSSIDYENGIEYKKLHFDILQYIINNDIKISQKNLQKKLLGEFFDILENNIVDLNIVSSYSYHFSANLVIPFFKKKCLEFSEFECVDATILDINYDENGFLRKIKIKINDNQEIFGDFFINCLGFNSNNILSKEYFDINFWDDYILNNSAFSIQVKNSISEIIEPYTSATAKEYGWCWKIPQYEKTGYGYVYSNDFVTDEDKLYNDLLKTYNIEEKNIFKTKIVKSKPFFNKKQLHKNCLSLGLSSGFVEPLEATSLHMTLINLNTFFEFIENDIEFNENYVNIFNSKIEKNWENIFKFIIHHYHTNNPINDYWKHYKNIHENKLFNFYEKYYDDSIHLNLTFRSYSYFLTSLGKRMKDYYYNFEYEKYLKNNYNYFLRSNKTINTNGLYSHNDVLSQINTKINYF